MDILRIVFAFGCGLGVKLLGLPPLIGFLAAGFALNEPPGIPGGSDP